MSNIDQGTRILNIDDRDSNWVKTLTDPYIPAPVGGYTKGLLSSVQVFYNLYALNPANIREGFDFSGTIGNIYQVKVSEDDLQGYLGDKITVSNGLTLTINGSSNEVIDFSLDIQETDVTNGVSLLNNSFTIKQIIAGDHISLVESDESITIVAEDISSEDVSVQPDESLNGVSINQKEVNEETVDNIENIYSLLQGQSPAYGDLVGDPLPQAVPTTEAVATWSTVKQSSDLDIWEFNDTLNEILVKKAGFYTWNTQVSLDNGSNQDRYLIFSTRDKNATGTIFYTRSILVPRNGTTSQTSIQFEVPTDNTTIEIVTHGETSTGIGSNDLTLTNWDTSFTLNFVLEPEVELGTNVITVFDSVSESLSGTATKQNGINEENKIAIQNIEDDYLKLDGTSEMTGSLNMGANFIYNVEDIDIVGDGSIHIGYIGGTGTNKTSRGTISSLGYATTYDTLGPTYGYGDHIFTSTHGGTLDKKTILQFQYDDEWNFANNNIKDVKRIYPKAIEVSASIGTDSVSPSISFSELDSGAEASIKFNTIGDKYDVNIDGSFVTSYSSTYNTTITPGQIFIKNDTSIPRISFESDGTTESQIYTDDRLMISMYGELNEEYTKLHTDVIVDGDLKVSRGLAIAAIATSLTTKLNIGNTSLFDDTSYTSSVLLTNQGGDYAIGNNTQAIVWAQQNSNGATLSASISLESRNTSGGTSDLVFKTIGNATGETMRLGDDGKIRLALLPNNSTGLISGELYTQLATELGGTSTIKVVCQA